jgi:hypothetical protein
VEYAVGFALGVEFVVAAGAVLCVLAAGPERKEE